jgi:transcriptional regulator with XRE-family HTH domain
MQAVSSIFQKGGYGDGLMAGGRPRTRQGTEFGQRLSEMRQQAGLTQTQLAEKIGVSQKVVTYWERESIGLKAEQLVAVADALGVKVDSLLGRDDPKPKGGPMGKTRQIFEQVSTLPRRQQERIASVVEALIAQAGNP